MTTQFINFLYIPQENEKRLTFQVIVVTGKDTEGSDRTILLMTMGHYYEVDSVSD